MISVATFLGFVGVGLIVSIFVVSKCAVCVSIADSLSAKIILVAAIDFLIVVVILQIYFATFLGSALRTTKSRISFCKIGLTASVSVPWTLYIVGAYSEEPKLGLVLKFSDAGYASVLSLAVSLIALYFFNERYIFLCRPTNRRWAAVD